jgi:hypothetical protein
MIARPLSFVGLVDRSVELREIVHKTHSPKEGLVPCNVGYLLLFVAHLIVIVILTPRCYRFGMTRPIHVECRTVRPVIRRRKAWGWYHILLALSRSSFNRIATI